MFSRLMYTLNLPYNTFNNAAFASRVSVAQRCQPVDGAINTASRLPRKGRRSIPSRDYRQRLKEIAAMQKRRDKFLNDKLDELQDGMRNGLEELGRMMRHMRKDLQEEMRGGQSTINNHVDALHLHMTRSVLRRVKQRRSYSAPLTLKSLPSIKMYLAAALGEGSEAMAQELYQGLEDLALSEEVFYRTAYTLLGEMQADPLTQQHIQLADVLVSSMRAFSRAPYPRWNTSGSHLGNVLEMFAAALSRMAASPVTSFTPASSTSSRFSSSGGREGSPTASIHQRLEMLEQLKELAAARAKVAEPGYPDATAPAALSFLSDSHNTANPTLLLLTTAARQYKRTGVDRLDLDGVGSAEVDVSSKKMSVEAVGLRTTNTGYLQVRYHAKYLGLLLQLGMGAKLDDSWGVVLTGSVYTSDKGDEPITELGEEVARLTSSTHYGVEVTGYLVS